MTLVEVLEELGIDYRETGHHHCTVGWVQTDCPSCSPNSGKFKMGINLTHFNSSCRSCGKQYTIKALAELSRRSYREVKLAMEGLYENMERLDEKDQSQEKGTYKPPEGLTELKQYHLNYLTGRGFDAKRIAEQWSLQATPNYGPFAWRIFIPIYFRRKPCSWTSRSCTESTSQRYRSARRSEEAVQHKSLLYGWDFRGHALLLCEGPTDCWAIGPGATCTFGTGYSRAQLLKMASFPKRYICFDNQPDGQKKAKELVDNLSLFDGETYNILLDAKDAGSASPSEIKKLRRLLE